MTRLWLWTVTPSTFFSVLCHFVILYMVSIEIVSFCRIISLWNFQYRNHVHSITLMSFQIISQNLVQYKAWLDDVQRLRTVTSLDVSAVAGHHAMPAAFLLATADLWLFGYCWSLMLQYLVHSKWMIYFKEMQFFSVFSLFLASQSNGSQLLKEKVTVVSGVLARPVILRIR